jgi:SNF2 family DNA or RNA helicase
MHVSTQHKKLVLNLREPDRVLTVIPTAKRFTLHGRDLVAVPHGTDEVRVLRNLGIQAPGPIRHHYQWSGPKTPTPQQITTGELVTLNDAAYVLNDMGTGKTLASLWAFDYLRSVGQAHRMLVMAPLSTLELTWMNTVFREFFHLTSVVVHGTRQRRLKLLREPADIYIINHDGLKAAGVVEEINRRPDIDVILIDELATFRNAQTDMWKAAAQICRPPDQRIQRRIWGMTGTPTPNAPTDAWAQCRLVTPHTVPRSFRRFKDLTMRQVTTFKWVPRDDWLEVVRTAMQPAVRFTLDECVDLPPLTYQMREVELSDEQAAVYKAMANKMKAEAAGAQITAVNAADKVSKLVQIACGAAYATDGGTLLMSGGPRIAELRSIIEQSAGKVIVFVPFVEALKAVADQLSDWQVEIVYGEVSKSDRDRIFAQFERPDSPGARVLVAHPKTMAHGLTLVAATTIVWYAPHPSNDICQQANARIRRPGQLYPTSVVQLCGTAVERRLYANIESKQELQSLLLESI